MSIRNLNRWTVKRGDKRIPAKCLKVSGKDLEAAGLGNVKLFTIETSPGTITIRQCPSS